ncbi:MAG: DUF1289 domain-containing protein [Sphingomonadales bacterium]|nr:DUF1289 domain-containing protein [Sphingomonadales bacterium]
MDEVASPCKDQCGLDRTGQWCLGCGRTVDEIAGWLSADAKERRAILDCLPARLLILSDHPSA